MSIIPCRFNMGQLLSTHIDSIELEGYKVVISFREEGELSDPTHASNIDFTDADSRYNVTAERNAIQANGDMLRLFPYYIDDYLLISSNYIYDVPCCI